MAPPGRSRSTELHPDGAGSGPQPVSSYSLSTGRVGRPPMVNRSDLRSQWSRSTGPTVDRSGRGQPVRPSIAVVEVNRLDSFDTAACEPAGSTRRLRRVCRVSDVMQWLERWLSPEDQTKFEAKRASGRIEGHVGHWNTQLHQQDLLVVLARFSNLLCSDMRGV